MTKIRKDDTQKLFKNFINYCDKTPSGFSTDNSIVLTNSDGICVATYMDAIHDNSRDEKGRFKTTGVEMNSYLYIAENELAGVTLLDKYKYAAYVEAVDLMPVSGNVYPYYHEILKDITFIASDNINSLKKHLEDVITNSVDMYEIDDKNLLDEMEPRIHVKLSVNNKERYLGEQSHLTKFQALNFKNFIDNALKSEEELQA